MLTVNCRNGANSLNKIKMLVDVLDESNRIYEELMNKPFIEPEITEVIGAGKNQVVFADNLSYMHYMILGGEMRGKVDLIYVDPPFFSGKNYKSTFKLGDETLKTFAYKDNFGLREYLEMLCIRLLFMRDLLSDRGSIWVHLDWHAVHYIRLLMDEIFGAENFINEIIWEYKSGGARKRGFSKKHDNLLFYGKTKDYYFKAQKEKSYNRGFLPYRFKGVKEYEDEIGWYTLVNRKDVWQVPMVGRSSYERTGYATQKPEALMDIIIDCCSDEGFLCADFFAGSASFAASAERFGRRWITVDAHNKAVNHTINRLVDSKEGFIVYNNPYCEENEEYRVSVDYTLSGEEEYVLDILINAKGRGRELANTNFGTEEAELVASNTGIRKPESETPDPGRDSGSGNELRADNQTSRKAESDFYNPEDRIYRWTVEIDPKDEVKRPDYIFTREKSKIKLNCQIKLKRKENLRIRIIDIFSNECIFEVRVDDRK